MAKATTESARFSSTTKTKLTANQMNRKGERHEPYTHSMGTINEFLFKMKVVSKYRSYRLRLGIVLFHFLGHLLLSSALACTPTKVKCLQLQLIFFLYSNFSNE